MLHQLVPVSTHPPAFQHMCPGRPGTFTSRVGGHPKSKVREKRRGGGIMPSRTATTPRSWPQRALNPSSSCPMGSEPLFLLQRGGLFGREFGGQSSWLERQRQRQQLRGFNQGVTVRINQGIFFLFVSTFDATKVHAPPHTFPSSPPSTL